MNGIIQMFFLGFLIGLTGALAPGPTLIATINASLKGGWSMGPRVTFGHIVVEILMVILIIAGLSVILGGYSWIVAGVGGVALVVFGTLTILESRHPGINFGQRTPVGGTTVPRPFVAGVVTSMSNPYCWLWWFSVGTGPRIWDGTRLSQQASTGAGFFSVSGNTAGPLPPVGSSWYFLGGIISYLSFICSGLVRVISPYEIKMR